MTLAELIRKRDAGSFANAKTANPANDVATAGRPLAELATLALANPAEVIAEPPRRTATRAEAGELRELIGLILPEADDSERAEALAVACADPEAALESFRLLAADATERKRHTARFGGA